MAIAESAFDYLLLEISKDSSIQNLDQIGFRIGTGLVERYRLIDLWMTIERVRFSDTLEIIKFICKEFWIGVFQKQIDNLKTNHRVMFCLHRVFMF
jgi:hypothetical protein